MAFAPATRQKAKARLLFGGMSKSGKSLSSLAIMRGIVGPEGRIAVIDSENGATHLYAGRFPGTQQPTGFDVDKITHFSPDKYISAINEAGKAGYDGLIIDSATQEWQGSGGILEIVDGASGDKFFTGWKNATPKHNDFIRAIVQSPCHVIVTVRQKDDYIIGTDPNGKNAPQRVGLALIQRKEFEYEFNAVGIFDIDHTLRFNWSAIDFLPNGTVVPAFDSDMLGAVALGQNLAEWLNTGDEAWTPPVYKKSFYVSGKEYISAGITQETFVKCLNLGTQLDKVSKRGAAKALIASTTGKSNLADLTKEESVVLVEALEVALDASTKEPSVQQSA